ncbi:hypothetical protein Ccrd_014013, partial [Cynara cardunculus var. scolymus]
MTICNHLYLQDTTASLFLSFPSILLPSCRGCFSAFPVQLYQVDLPSMTMPLNSSVSLEIIEQQPDCAQNQKQKGIRLFPKRAIMQGVVAML